MPRSRATDASDTLQEPLAPKLPAILAPAEDARHDLVDEASLVALEFDGSDLARRRAASVEIDQCRFGDTALSQTELSRALISDARFEHCDMANLVAHDCAVLRVAVSGSRLTGLSWSDGTLREVAFEGCRMDMASFRFSRFRDVVLRDCALTQADFEGADLCGARFERCDLSGARFSGARMRGTRFTGCELTAISGVTSLAGAIVSNTDVLSLAYDLAAALDISIEQA